MKDSGNGLILGRHISRTSSQKQSHRMDPGVQDELQVNGIAIERAQSLVYSFANIQNKSKQKSNPKSISKSNEIFQAMPQRGQQPEIGDTKSSVQIYNTYKQMCRDFEFIQMLGNPQYVISLYDHGYFFNKQFREYLNALKSFFKEDKLVQLIRYPEGLFNLDLMLKKGFMQTMESEQLRKRFVIQCLKRNLEFKSSLRWWKNLSAQANLLKEQKQK